MIVWLLLLFAVCCVAFGGRNVVALKLYYRADFDALYEDKAPTKEKPSDEDEREMIATTLTEDVDERLLSQEIYDSTSIEEC